MEPTRALAPQVLFISRQRLVGATNGSSAYLIDLARAVRAAGMVPHLVQPSPTVAGRWPVLVRRAEMAVFASHRIRGLWRIGNRFVSPDPRVWLAVGLAGARAAGRWLVARLADRLADRLARTLADRPMPYAPAVAWTRADHAWLAQAARGRADIAIADYMFCAAGFADLPATPCAIMMHDLFHARAGGAADSVAQISEAEEIALLSRADAVIAIQPDEAGWVARAVPGVEAICAPMAARPVAAPQPGEDDRLLFVGSNTAPNTVGLDWFLAQVWPRIRAARPAARLDIAGSVARGLTGPVPDGVRVLGVVDALAPLYARAGVVISPLPFGSGLKIKLVEALAAGKAIVATPVTLQGVEQACAGAVRVAGDAAGFADQVVQLAGDLAARTALATRALAVAHATFGPQAAHAAFADWLRRQTRLSETRQSIRAASQGAGERVVSAGAEPCASA